VWRLKSHFIISSSVAEDYHNNKELSVIWVYFYKGQIPKRIKMRWEFETKILRGKEIQHHLP
jgi:hypothetical protein